MKSVLSHEPTVYEPKVSVTRQTRSALNTRTIAAVSSPKLAGQRFESKTKRPTSASSATSHAGNNTAKNPAWWSLA